MSGCCNSDSHRLKLGHTGPLHLLSFTPMHVRSSSDRKTRRHRRRWSGCVTGITGSDVRTVREEPRAIEVVVLSRSSRVAAVRA